MLNTYQAQLTILQANPVGASSLAVSGRSAASPSTPEVGALTQLMRVLFNLTETITSE